MKTGTSRCEAACILMHLNGGFTKVLLERTVGIGLANGGIEVDIPTACIPFHLRAISSRFLVTLQSAQPGPAWRQLDSPINVIYISPSTSVP